jgi:flagellar basal-body rod protein FlgB
MEWMDSVPMTLLQKDLDGLWTRQRAVTNNIANFETPGYKSKSVSFEDLLRAQVSDPSKTDEETVQGLENVQPVTEELQDVYRADGNGVDLEKESLNLARTQLNYSYSLQELSDSFARLKTAIGTK